MDLALKPTGPANPTFAQLNLIPYSKMAKTKCHFFVRALIFPGFICFEALEIT